MGRHCELPQCPLRCLNGGVCFKPYTCICQLGYEGSQCQHSSNGGQIILYSYKVDFN